jgi:hypothetical protein
MQTRRSFTSKNVKIPTKEKESVKIEYEEEKSQSAGPAE